MKIKILFFVTACKKSGPIQQMLSIIKNLDRDAFEPILLTIYPENHDGSSQLPKYLPYVKHYFVQTNKIEIMTGTDFALKNILKEISPDVIHTLGTFPNFAISRLKRYKQLITLRNYIYEDGFDKYGYFLSTIMAKMNLSSINKATKTITCSKSLSNIYNTNLSLNFDYICNGIDVDKYTKAEPGEKYKIREQLNLPFDKKIIVYSGQFIKRKNQKFLLEVFTNYEKQDSTVYLLLLGDGNEFNDLRDKFSQNINIDFRGNVSNVNDYLKASDLYISTSKSEGMPNGVLEAMATGLPVLLSNIPQHLEIYTLNSKIGGIFRQGNVDDLKNQLHSILNIDLVEAGNNSFTIAHKNFNSIEMSKEYQKLYYELNALE